MLAMSMRVDDLTRSLSCCRLELQLVDENSKIVGVSSCCAHSQVMWPVTYTVLPLMIIGRASWPPALQHLSAVQELGHQPARQ